MAMVVAGAILRPALGPDCRKMAYIVQADVPGNNAASVTIAEREKAFAIARNWIKSGYTGVKVIGDGRIYLPAEFDKEDPAGS
jgi:hypothetical protein